MAKERLSKKALYVEKGYGQVEPNHLSAQRTSQIYAQLPAAADIEILENGQFVKYDYLNEEVNFTGAGEWMLVFNEVKVYEDFLSDQDFAMIKANYVARVYSPIDGTDEKTWQSRFYGGKDANGASIEKVTAPANPYTLDSTENPFAGHYKLQGPKAMKENTVMVPRVFKTNVGDIYTTNCIAETELVLGDLLTPNAEGYLAKVATAAEGEEAAPVAAPSMQWQVVKKYTLGDRQKAVKLMRIA